MARQTMAEYQAHCARDGIDPDFLLSVHRRCKPSRCNMVWSLPIQPGDVRWAEHEARWPGSVPVEDLEAAR